MRKRGGRYLGDVYVVLAYVSAVAYIVLSEGLSNFLFGYLPANLGKIIARVVQ